MGRPPLFDTNVLISGAYSSEMKYVTRFFLSAIVVQELLAGRNEQVHRMILRTANELERRSLLLIPSKEDWYEVGNCLRKLSIASEGAGRKLTKEYLSSLVRDALIARSAIRADAVVVTSNTTDFDRIKSVFRSLVHVTPAEFFGERPR